MKALKFIFVVLTGASIGLFSHVGATLPVASGGGKELKDEPVIARDLKQNLELRVQISENRVAGEPIIITLSLKNLSGKDVLYGHISEYRDFSLRIENSKGELVRLTRFGETIIGKEPGEHFKYVTKTLPANGELRHQYNLSRVFDLTLADTYSIKVTREVNENSPNKITLEVPKLQFKVSEP